MKKGPLVVEIVYTLPETNIARKNGWLEYYFPIREAYFEIQIELQEGEPI